MSHSPYLSLHWVREVTSVVIAHFKVSSLRSVSAALLLVSSCSSVFALGCAASEGDDGSETEGAPSDSTPTQTDKGTASPANPYESTATTADAGVSNVAPWAVPDAGSSSPSSPSSQPADSGAPKPTPIPAEPCAASETCSAPTAIGTVSGDDGAGTITKQGSKSAWLAVRLTQDNQGWSYSSMKLRGSLINPPGASFEMHLYVDTTKDELQCAAPSFSAGLGSGATNQATLKWDTGWLDYSDQSRTVIVEVRQTSGECRPNEKWSLLLEGNRE